MKTEIDASIKQYEQNNAPSLWLVFTMPNAVKSRNIHIVQKVFEMFFEFDIIYSFDSAKSTMTCKTIESLFFTESSERQNQFNEYWRNHDSNQVNLVSTMHCLTEH